MKPPIRLVVLDMAGTTVADDGAVEEAFQRALDAVGLTAGNLAGDPADYIRRTMGQSKITVFTELLGGDQPPGRAGQPGLRGSPSTRPSTVARSSAIARSRGDCSASSATRACDSA